MIPRTRRLTVALACGIAVGAIGVTDVTTGPEFRFGFLYLAPIVVAGGWAGRGYALTCAAAGIALLLVNDVMLRSEATGLGLLWNEFTRATTFFASALLSAHLRQAWDRLRHEKEDAFSLAIRDPLTGVYNRIFLREQIQLLDALATRHGRPYCVIALDLDGLKELNDREGHAAGDEALSSFASDAHRRGRVHRSARRHRPRRGRVDRHAHRRPRRPDGGATATHPRRERRRRDVATGSHAGGRLRGRRSPSLRDEAPRWEQHHRRGRPRGRRRRALVANFRPRAERSAHGHLVVDGGG